MRDRRRLRAWLEQGWYGSRPSPLLQPLAWIYAAVVLLRRHAFSAGLFRARHPGVPVVIVGNLGVGGTGKTPLVLWLAAQLSRRGLRPGIVLRGYGGSRRAARLVQADDSAEQVGDEAVLLARRAGCPVAVGADRFEAAAILVQAGCGIVIADDGLQHLALKRDLSVVVVDGARGFGNGALLPAGPLREPVSRLAEADLVVLHGADLHQAVPPALQPLHMQLLPTALRHLTDDREEPQQSLQGATVHAFAGIGHPQRFFATLRALGAAPVEHARPDHHRYSAGELRRGDGRRIVMTEKDAVKCRTLAAPGEDIYYLQVAAQLPEPDAARLLDRVMAICKGN